ncbi:MAG: PKD domain-containing protein [Dehalococcoidia bacterium]|nr:PKD domain-containing protein [Dehalococcoidia bacterium]
MAASAAADDFARRFERYRDPPAAAALVGIEHEFRVLGPAGAPVDFRELLPNLPVRAPRLDPGDRNARRLPTGLALTADGPEAEIATPPVPVVPGFERHAAALAAEGRATLAALLPAGHTLEGYSTHVSLSVPGGGLDAFAREYALVFGPAIAALGESPRSLGIYVRPRPGRLELCFEFAEDTRLATVIAVAAGTVRALYERAQGLPRALDVNLLPARERYGYRLHRRAAFGFDSYTAGREALLPLVSGGNTTLGARTGQAIASAIHALGPALDPETASLLNGIAAGRHPLGIEGGALPALAPATDAPAFAAPRPWHRPGYRAVPCIATWDFTLYRLEGARTAFACVPRAAHPAFVSELEAGALDAIIVRFLAAPAASATLASHAQTTSAALFDRMTPDPRALLPSEREPALAHVPGAAAKADKASARPGKAGPGRPGKGWLPAGPRFDAPPVPATPRPPSPPPSPVPARPRPGLMLAGLAATLAAAAAVIAMVLFAHGGGEAANPSPSPTSEQPPHTSTASPSPTTIATAAPPAATVIAPAGVPSPTAAATAATATPPDAVATATAAATSTATATATPLATSTATATPAATSTATAHPAETPPPTATATPTPTPPPAVTPTPTRTATPAPTPAPPSIRNVTCTTIDRNVPATCQVFMGDTGPEATSFTWTAQGGTPATGSGTTFHPVFTTAGQHTVTVTACAGTACATRTTSVTVV